MSRYDQPTQDFMRELLGGEIAPKPEPQAIKYAEDKVEQTEQEQISTKPIRVARQIIKAIEDPRKALGKAIVSAAAHEIMDKQGTIKVVSLYNFMNTHYKNEWWDWEPETIWTMLEHDHLDATPREVKEAVMALQVIVNTFAPFESWNVFEKVGHALNMNHVDFGILQPIELNEAALAMRVLAKIRPGTSYETEVLQYVAVCAKASGVVYLPDDMFPAVQPKLDEITFEHNLRDATKQKWDNPKDDISGYQKRFGISRDQLEIQIYRLLDVKNYLVKEMGDA